MSCVVPDCKSNYRRQEESTSAFHFPRDQKLLDINNFHCSSESLNISFNLLVGQLRNLINSKSRRRYSTLTQVFSLKIHGISPACYRIIQSSNCLILPHERNLISIKNILGIEGDYSQILKEVTSKFSHRERHVILQMDEVTFVVMLHFKVV